MPFYEFDAIDGFDENGQPKIVRKTIQCSLEDLPRKTKYFEDLGWKRAYSIPNIQVVPGYHEALEETHELVAKEDRERVVEAKKGKENLKRAIKNEFKNDLPVYGTAD